MGKRAADLVLVNGQVTSFVSVEDRGLAYGDGLFETMRLNKGQIPLLDYHIRRLREGLKRLFFNDIDSILSRVSEDLQQMLTLIEDQSGPAIVKLIVTRGGQGRGYQPHKSAKPTLIFKYSRFLAASPEKYSQGIAVTLASHPLPDDPQLAGIKHLNRLEQVLAAIELDNINEREQLANRPVFDDILLLNPLKQIIESSKANLLYLKDGQIFTPVLQHSGVHGVMLSYLKSIFPEIQARPLDINEIGQVAGMALTNSVFGILPVRRLDQKYFDSVPWCSSLLHTLELSLDVNFSELTK